MKGAYKGNKREGVFIFYSGGNRHTEAGRYVNDKRFGKWETFHENGRLASEVYYNNSYFLQSLYDSVGNQLVVDGNGREVQHYPNGVVATEGEYRHGVKQGYWYGRYPTGEMYYEEIFSGGVLVSGQSRTLDGQTFVYDSLQRLTSVAGVYGRIDFGYEGVGRTAPHRFESVDGREVCRFREAGDVSVPIGVHCNPGRL